MRAARSLEITRISIALKQSRVSLATSASIPALSDRRIKDAERPGRPARRGAAEHQPSEHDERICHRDAVSPLMNAVPIDSYDIQQRYKYDFNTAEIYFNLLRRTNFGQTIQRLSGFDGKYIFFFLTPYCNAQLSTHAKQVCAAEMAVRYAVLCACRKVHT